MNGNVVLDLKNYHNEDEFIEKWKDDSTLSQQIANFIPGSTMFSPLERTIYKDWFNATKLFIKKGAPINATDIYKKPPLAYALLWGQYKIAQLLIDSGVDFTITNHITLFELVKDCKYAAIKLLIANRCPINVRNGKNETVMSFALFRLTQLERFYQDKTSLIKIIKLLVVERLKMITSIFHTLPQYIILWITNWLEGSEYLLEYQKVPIIEGVLKSINKIKC